MQIGTFSFVLETCSKPRTNQQYLHVYDGDVRITSYGARLNRSTGKFESSLVLIEDTYVFEVINVVSKLIKSIKRVKVNPSGYAKNYGELKPAYTVWERSEKK